MMNIKTRIVGTSEKRWYLWAILEDSTIFIVSFLKISSKYGKMLRYDRIRSWVYQFIILYICMLETFHYKTQNTS